MKFSYPLLKKLSPKLPDRAKFVEQFNLRAFEAEAVGDDTVEISIPANRYSDAASHWGIAKVAGAIFGGQVKDFSKIKPKKAEIKTSPLIEIESKKRNSRYIGRYFELGRIPSSPAWLRETLIACGLRPINAVVDIMNYVMLETGQPLHAFDSEKIEGAIHIRLAGKGEEIKTIDGGDYKLSSEDLVIADKKGPLAIAGIKGGKRAEVVGYTKKIIVESANFEPSGIYKGSRSLNLFTDASSRFSHGLKPMLAEIAMNRATELLKEICGARLGGQTDLNYARRGKTVLKFDIKAFNKLTGLDLKEKEALDYLRRAGFIIKGKMAEAPPLRSDIERFEDLAEEIVNLYGYDKLPATPPRVTMLSAWNEDQVMVKDKSRVILKGFGLSEVYNYSFVSRKDLTEYADPKWWGAVTLRNPISADFQYLRPSLVCGMIKNGEDNLRFYDTVRIFEVGKVFSDRDGKLDEKIALGILLAAKKGSNFLELKGLADQLLRGLGLMEFSFVEETWDMKYYEEGSYSRIESEHHVVGRLGIVKDEPSFAFAEFYLDELTPLIAKEKEYLPLSKYPAVERDISVAVDQAVRVGDLQGFIENESRLLEDVDLVDWFDDENKVGAGKKSLTFRLRFQSDDRTLTDEEVSKEMEKIVSALETTDAEIR